MAADKKISELPVIPGIGANDISVLVNNGVDYQFSISLLLQYLTSNLTSGASVSFGAVLPQNNSGKNGDVFLKTSTGQFAQKISGSWAVMYTLPEANAADGTLLYGAGTPATALGKNNDSYIDTLSGVFYQKRDLGWHTVFSMQTGPQGPKGIQGETGRSGQDGRTILNGEINPANSLGSNGDFYINTATYRFFGPKTNGDWGVPVSMFFQPTEPYTFSFTAGGSNPIIIENWQSDFYTEYGNAEFAIQLVDDEGNLQDRPDIGIKRIINRSGQNPIQTGITLDMPEYPDGRIIIKYSNLTLI